MQSAKQQLALSPAAVRGENRLLDCLLQREPQLAADLKVIRFDAGREIYRPGATMPYTYFPFRGVVSLIVQLSSGESAEVGTVGSEGLLGLPALLRVRRSSLLVVQQVAGDLASLPTSRMLRAMQSNDRLLASIECYAAYMLRAAHQTAGCNALHRLEARAARWLLMTADRAGGPEFSLTQQRLADMLGVGRQSVNEVAARFQRSGIIEYHRGRVRLVQRERLEGVACECYFEMSRAYDDLMS
jgi:CRP-like cAMP-binding protein